MPEIYIFYAFAGFAAIFVAEAVYLLATEGGADKGKVNRRMRISDPEKSRQEVMVTLRRERGLTASGDISERLAWLSRLIVQCGITIGLPKLMAICAATGVIIAGLTFNLTHDLLKTAIALPTGGIFVPLLVLRHMRKRRQDRFSLQFPEAIELIIRSLKAGHPVPVAMSMVAREMSDPIGTEFGLMADEVTYGSDLVTALTNMQQRVGQEDMPLFVTAVSIQSSTGGNLREILQGLTDVIRQRIKMRRKIRSISAEGRISAIFLTAMPVALFLVLNLISPHYYGDVWGKPMTTYGIMGALAWLGVGNLMMKKMISFKF
ncbi:type II secretion system F family protein [Oryzibacter oryziterrae]|uniref:type II secretion system F family protein n=1 Tax=Oryzibacter oryziterrae TaxID=2766474 RepID=UPI001F20C09F|nr:type II secretion system F family protein [Oryzibacter oryziterrae]